MAERRLSYPLMAPVNSADAGELCRAAEPVLARLCDGEQQRAQHSGIKCASGACELGADPIPTRTRQPADD